MNNFEESVRILEVLEGLAEDGRDDEIRQEIYGSFHRLLGFSEEETNHTEEEIDEHIAKMGYLTDNIDEIIEKSLWDDNFDYDTFVDDFLGSDFGKELERNSQSHKERFAFIQGISELQKSHSLTEYIKNMKRGLELEEGFLREIKEIAANPDYEPPKMKEEYIEDFRSFSPQTIENLDNDYSVAIQSAIGPVAKKYSAK